GAHPRADGGQSRRRAVRRCLRQPWDRPADAGPELRTGRRGDRPAERERHPRRGCLSRRGRRRPGPDQRRQGDGDLTQGRVLLRLGNQLRDDPRRQGRRRDPRRHAGLRDRRHRQLDDPRQDGQGHGRCHGPGRGRQAGDRADGARCEEEGRHRGPEDPAQVHPPAHRRRRGRPHHHRPGRAGRHRPRPAGGGTRARGHDGNFAGQDGGQAAV
ncbi:MAG: Succinyl-CoA:3-ketoacid-coenzyme A transferase subunit B, partial [uncultured Ramlibacter sp.]